MEILFFFKDLGMQLTWTQLYVIEYMGPLVLYILTYLRPPLMYDNAEGKKLTYEQNVALICWTFHFAKRVLESAFIHKFGGDFIGISFLIKNCCYYWGFGLFIGFFTNHPLFTPVGQTNIFQIGLVLFFLAELGNGYIHWTLANLRPEGSKDKKIPTGIIYTLLGVSFPNYTFEVIAWIAWNMMFFSIPGVLFLILGTGQMVQWAIKKHRRYVVDFDGKDGKPLYPKRKAMFPFLL